MVFDLFDSKIRERDSNSQSRRTQPQMEDFMVNGNVDLKQSFNELNRRLEAMGRPNSNCSFERFETLSKENGQLSKRSAREGLSVAHAEEGYNWFKNAFRENYGENINGIDYRATGIGEYEYITHVEIKNPVGVDIKKTDRQNPSIEYEGEKIGARSLKQNDYWSDGNIVSKLKNVNSTAVFPQSPNNILVVVDLFDVPKHEKALMKESIMKGAKNNPNIVFLNMDLNDH
jgi:hypothetical protein